MGTQSGPDFPATWTGQVSYVEGSFDPVTAASTEFTVTCPLNSALTANVCPTNPTFNSATQNEYSLQLNSEFFTTTTCSSSPWANANTCPACANFCQGWEQFVYDPIAGNGGLIRYWLINYGPLGTPCPPPVSAHCKPKEGLWRRLVSGGRVWRD